MGLGIRITADVRGEGLLRRMPSRDKVLTRVAFAIRDAVADPLLRQFVQADLISGEQLHMAFHSAGDLECSFNGKGRLVLKAQTSVAGPGFHAFLVDVLARALPTCGLNYSEKGGERGVADEADYWRTRDFSKLQHEMAAFLRAACRACQNKETGDLAINMPFARIRTGGLVATPMGLLSRDRCRDVAACEPGQLEGYAAAFYPWWDQGCGATFWRGYGLALLWAEIPWHPPVDDRERKLYRRALTAFRRARELDRSLALPQREIAEMEALLAYKGDMPPVPAPDGIGFRRRTVVEELNGGWSVDMPGYYYHGLEDDGATLAYWFRDRSARFTSIRYYSRGDNMWDTAGDALFAKERERGEEIIQFSDGCTTGRAVMASGEEDGRPVLILRTATQVTGYICFGTFTYSDPADRQWAEEVWRSVSRLGGVRGR